MAMLALVASVVLMGVTANAANAAGVTEIRVVKNLTPCYVYVENHESGAKKLISPYSKVEYNQWVPWATNATEFNRGKYIELGFYGYNADNFCAWQGWHFVQGAMWQEGHSRQPYPGDFIRYTREMKYNPSAPSMAGASYTGGRRHLFIRHTIAPTTGYAVMQATLCLDNFMSDDTSKCYLR